MLQAILHFICSTTEKHNILNILPCRCHQLYFIFRIKAAKVNITCQMTHININPLYNSYTYVWLPILLSSHIDQCRRNISWFPFCFVAYFLLNMNESYVQGAKAVKYSPFFFYNNIISYVGVLVSQNGGHFGDKMGFWINWSCCRQKSTLSC